MFTPWAWSRAPHHVSFFLVWMFKAWERCYDRCTSLAHNDHLHPLLCGFLPSDYFTGLDVGTTSWKPRRFLAVQGWRLLQLPMQEVWVWSPGQGAKFLHALWPKYQNIKQKQHGMNKKFNKDFKREGGQLCGLCCSQQQQQKFFK